MLVSIIVPVYNGERYIKRCLDSILNQVYKNIEVIVIDDNSTDNTRSILKEYAEKDNRILPLYSSLNKGVSSSRNVGLQSSMGDYIMFVDADDELLSDAIRRMVDIAIKYNSDYVDSYQIVSYTSKNNKQYKFTENKLSKNTLVLGNIIDNPKIINMYMYIKGKLIKRSLIGDTRFDTTFNIYEDLLFELELKLKITNYVMINKPIYIYYQRENSLINTLGEKHLCILNVIKKIKDMYIDNDKKVYKVLENMLFTNAILTLFTKVIKNDKSINYNTDLLYKSLNDLIEIFPDYKYNKNINFIIRKLVNKSTSNKNFLRIIIKLTYKKNFIKLYFRFLSLRYKYKN